MRAWRARASTVSGWSSRSSAQGKSSPRGWLPSAGRGVAMNWAWPPSRWGGATRRRAVVLAPAEPGARRGAAGGSGVFVGACRAVVEADQVQAQVHGGGLARGGEDVAVVDVE